MHEPPDAWPEYGTFQPPSGERVYEVLGDTAKIRWTLWPFCKEVYVGDEEPPLQIKGKSAPVRILLWDRINRTDIPAGWRAEGRPWRVDGIGTLSLHEDYTRVWKKDAQRNVKQWREELSNGIYRVEFVSYPEFKKAYARSIVYKKVGTFYTDTFERRPAHPDRETLVCLIYHLASNAYIAGTIMHFFTKRSTSVRECSFMLGTAERTLAPTGLMDVWHHEAQKRNLTSLHFIYLWQSGDPLSWKRYSDFKERFGLTRLVYPPRLKRFAYGKIF